MVSQLLVAEADVLLVARAEKQAQDVGTALPRRASTLPWIIRSVRSATRRDEIDLAARSSSPSLSSVATWL